MGLTFDYSKLRNDAFLAGKLKAKKKKSKNKHKKLLSVSFTEKQLKQKQNNKEREESPMETKIKLFLRKKNIHFVQEYSNTTLINPKTNYLLFIDFYLPKLNIAIEYDGKQHFIDENKEKLKSQKYRDKIKDKWCKDHGIKLLRINYLQQDKYEELINNFLN